MFSYTQAWVSEGSRNLKISAKMPVFLVLNGKKQIPLFLADPRKTFGKIQWCSP